MPEAATGCDQFEADLSALLDDELTPERAAEVRDHSRACQGCRERLARLARVDAALSRATALAVPASLRARLEARLASAHESDTKSRRTPRAGAPRPVWRGRAAGVLAAAAAGVALYLAVATREPARPEAEPSPVQIARPLVEPPREAPQQVAKHPAPARSAPAAPPAPVPGPAESSLDLASVPEEDLGLALEIETVEDLDVIANLELLELVLAAEAS